MADPQLLVDQSDRLVERRAALVGDADVGEGEELEDTVILAPDRAQLIFGPAALDLGDDLLVFALMAPAMGSEIIFEHVDRRGVLAVELGFVEHHNLMSVPSQRSAKQAGAAQAQRLQP